MSMPGTGVSQVPGPVGGATLAGWRPNRPGRRSSGYCSSTPIIAKTKWSKPIYEQAARRLIETGGGAMSHMVGMAVHDVGSYRGLLKPGHVFSVDPQLWVPEENLYFRYEDTVVVTETGVENFTAFLPSDLAALEKAVGGPNVRGIVQQFPPESP